MFRGKKEAEKLEEITPERKVKLDEFVERGNRFEDDGQKYFDFSRTHVEHIE